jgi:hypothetical protein
MTTDEYLGAADDEPPAIAAAEVMDRLAERLNSVGTTAERMKETRAAAEAVAELAAEADEPLAPIESAENAAGSVAEKGRTPKDTILEAISEATKEVRQQAAEQGLSLGHGYALDRYLEEGLEVVRRIESTDHNTETTLSWQFSDGVAVEIDDGTHLEKYNFWKKLAQRTKKKLQPDLVSEEIGDPEEHVDEYARLSIGPASRPWAEQYWIRCITDLLEERQETVETAGARTMTWEAVANEIRLSRAVSGVEAAVDQTMPHAKLDDGEMVEIWLPGKLITQKCEEFGITTKALQEELSAREINSDDLGGERISERVVVDGNGVRFWRLDATREEVPDPAEIVDEVETGLDRLQSMEWGSVDDE